MYRREGSDSEEVGWISMVDLLVVLACVGVIVIGSVAVNQGATPTNNGDQTIDELISRIAELEKQVGDWRVVEDDLQQRLIDCQRANDAKAPASEPPSSGPPAQTGFGTGDAGSVTGAGGEGAPSPRGDGSPPAPIPPTPPGPVGDGKDRSDQPPKEPDGRGVKPTDAPSPRQSEASDPTAREGRVKKELLGLPGDVGNVIFVVDRSLSMNEGGRWPDAKRTIQSWVQHLPVKRAAVVLFGSGIRTLPAFLGNPDALAPDSVSIPEVNDELRQTLATELSGVEPGGNTPTYAALRRAMDFKDVDAIILFTDGKPDALNNGVGDPGEEVLQLIRDWRAGHPNARVHSVGVGDYFNKPMRDFLLGVAQAGDGAFIGR